MSANTWFFLIKGPVRATLLILAFAALSSACRPEVVVPELKINVGTMTLHSGESAQVTVEGAKPPFQFSILEGTGQIDPNTGVFTASEDGGDVIIRTVDGDGRAQDLTVHTIGRLEVLPQTGRIRHGGSVAVSARRGVPPYSFTVSSGPAAIDSSSGLLTTSGSGEVIVQVTDSEGRSASERIEIAPMLTIAMAAPVSGSFIHAGNDSNSFALSGSCNEAGLAVQVRVDGATPASGGSCDGSSWSALVDTSALDAGTHTIQVSLADNDGYSAETTASVTKDVTLPAISGLSNDGVAAKTKLWTWSCSESCTYRYVIDTNALTIPSGAYGSATSASQTSGTGTYYLHVQARDAAGNESPVTHVSASLDNTDPASPSGLSLVNPATSPGASATPAIRISGVVSGDTVQLFSDSSCSTLQASGVASGATIDLTTSALSVGNHSFYAKATDPAGNASACSGATVAYEYDSTAPAVTGLANDAAAATTKTWTWGCSKAGCTYRYVIDTNAATVPAGAYGATTSAAQNSGTGTYYLHVQAKDAAGLESAVVHVSAVLDNAAPGVPSVLALVTPASSPGAVASPVIRVSGVVSGDTITLYSDSSCSTQKASGAATGTTIDLTSSALSVGNYTFYAKATDSLGNASACSTASIAYQYQTASVAVTGLSNDATYRKTKSWTWGCSAASCTYRYVVNTVPDTLPGGAYGAATSAAQNSGTGTYYLHVQAKDSSNVESPVVHVSAFLDNTPPTTPGSIDDGTTSASLTATPAISWAAATDSGAGLGYYEVAIGTVAGGTQLVNWTNVGSVTSTSFGSLSLLDGGIYYATVRAKDKLGNISDVRRGDGWTVSAGTNGSAKLFPFTGANQTFTVPEGVTSIVAKAWGGGGGGGAYIDSISDGGNGAGGAFAQSTLAVSPGDVLTVIVGGGGKTVSGCGGTRGLGGWPNGAGGDNDDNAWLCAGGGGAGSTSILKNGVRVLEAGGGGGGGSASDGVTGEAYDGSPGQATSGTCGSPGGQIATMKAAGGGYCAGATSYKGGFSFGTTLTAGLGQLPGNNAAPCSALFCGRGGLADYDGTHGLVQLLWGAPANAFDDGSSGWTATYKGDSLIDAANPLPFIAEDSSSNGYAWVKIAKTLDLGTGTLSVTALSDLGGGIMVKIGGTVVLQQPLSSNESTVSFENTITGTQTVEILVDGYADEINAYYAWGQISAISIPIVQ